MAKDNMHVLGDKTMSAKVADRFNALHTISRRWIGPVGEKVAVNVLTLTKVIVVSCYTGWLWKDDLFEGLKPGIGSEIPCRKDCHCRYSCLGPMKLTFSSGIVALLPYRTC